MSKKDLLFKFVSDLFKRSLRVKPWHNESPSKYATNYNEKIMQKNYSNRHLKKHKHEKRYTYCPPKNTLPRNLDKKPHP